MGRNAKPIALHVAEGNPNRLTKAEIAARANNEIKLGKTDIESLKPPKFISDDAIAFAHWKDCLKEYTEATKQGIEILTSSDVDLLALYCQTYSEYQRLLVFVTEDLETEIKKQNAINKKMDMLIKMQDRLFLNPLAKVKNIPKPKKEEKAPSKFAKFGAGRSG